MKSKMKGVLGVALTLVLMVSLTAGMAVPAVADPAELEWSKMPFPKAGAHGDWFRSEAITAVGPIAMAIDGSLFAFVDGEDILVKSEDGGRTWTKTKYAGDDIVAIVPSSEDADIVYVATVDTVWKSTNVFSTTAWKKLAEDSLSGTGGLLTDKGSNNTSAEEITCLDVGYLDGNPFAFVGSKDADAGDYDGGVYYLNEAAYGAGWANLEVDIGQTDGEGDPIAEQTSLDVYAVAVAPDFEDTSQVIAVVTGDIKVLNLDDVRTFVTNNKGTPGTWTGDVQLLESEANAFEIVGASLIRFPSDFDSSDAYEVFVGAVALQNEQAGTADVYRVLATIAYDLDVAAIDITGADDGFVSLDLVGAIGSTYLLAGQYGDNEVYRSDDDGGTWAKTKKAPSGIGPTYVLVTDDFDDSGEAWAATKTDGNQGGAFSFTRDGGVLWNGISLINTDNTYTVQDIAFGSDRFMVTDPTAGPTNNDVWKYDDEYWERVECIAGVDLAQTSPEYESDTAVFVADKDTGDIWRSTDGGGRFIPLSTDPGAAISAWLVVDSLTLISCDGSDIWKTTDRGRTPWKDKGDGDLRSFALSPDYADDETIIAGDDNGDTYRSTDAGDLWKLVGTSVLTGDTYVAFDPGYADNETIFAAGDDEVARYNGTKWETIGITTATSGFALSAASGLVCSADGTLYATDSALGAPVTVADAFTIKNISSTSTSTTYPPTLTVTSGSVLLTPDSGSNAGAGVNTPNTVTAPGSATLAIIAGGHITVEALLANSAGVWTNDSYNRLVAGITVDADGDVSVEAFAGAWSLPDVVVTVPGAGFAGMGRTLAPTAPTEGKCEWENVTKGATTVNLSKLHLTYGNILWGISGAYVYTYEDTLAVPVVLKSPADGASSGREDAAAVSWEALSGAKKYEVKANTREDFKGATVFHVTDVGVAADVITALSSGSTYYWKVRVAAGEPVLSRWSEIWSFTTAMGEAEWNPFKGPVNEYPVGATDVPLRPAFAWNPADWATGYEFELSASPGTTARGYFVDVLVGKTGANALVNTVWQLDIDLDYSTTYYWHVKAISATSSSNWATGVFTTMAKPVVAPAPPPPVELPPAPAPITPAWIWAIVVIGAVLVIAVIVLIVTTRRVP